MNDYICINNQKIELTGEQVAKLRESLGISNTRLSEVAVGETFKIGEHEFVVLEHSGDTTAVIYKGLLYESVEFGSNNNYDGSNIDAILKEFTSKLIDLVGDANIAVDTVDLTSNDGLKDYGKVKRGASLLTADRYRRYVDILDKHKIDAWWWLATPFSTERHGSPYYVLCVSPSGDIIDYGYNGRGGVRPFCILKSNIFVSK